MLKEVHESLDKVLPLTYFAVPLASQEAAIAFLGGLVERIEQHRKKAIERQDEPAANLAWTLSAFAEGISRFVLMWVHLKHDRMQSAWNALIDAEDNIQAGLKTETHKRSRSTQPPPPCARSTVVSAVSVH